MFGAEGSADLDTAATVVELPRFGDRVARSAGSEAADSLEMRPRRHPALPYVGAGAVALAVGVAFYLAKTSSGDSSAPPAPRTAASVLPPGDAQTAAEGYDWVPPSSSRTPTIVIPTQFAVTDANLGCPFDAKFTPLSGPDGVSLFAPAEARHVQVDAMEKRFEELRSEEQLDAGVSYLLASGGARYKATHRYRVY
ncbi:MAG: hypothetical protein K8W52_11190, partial [Deltaproteobacteria bacterium]|nr:hypothetical protein [Deltaproteobacteria bacterium]